MHEGKPHNCADGAFVGFLFKYACPAQASVCEALLHTKWEGTTHECSHHTRDRMETLMTKV